MEVTSGFSKTEELIVRNQKFVFTIVSYVIALMIFLNLSFMNSVIIGTLATFVYFLVNGIFLGNAFFKEESLFIRFALGNLVLFTLLGTVAWLAITIYNIDTIRTAIVLFTVVTLCSVLNVLRKKRGEQAHNIHSSVESGRSGRMLRPRIFQIAYLFMAALSFYLLFSSRKPEVYTVWNAMHPAFMPVFFITTLVLFLSVFSSDKVGYKLALIIIHSILVNTFFVFIFPASGDVGGQQTVLGNARLLYDNIIPRGLGVSAESPFIIPHIFMEGFLNAFTVIFARMFAIDIFWAHVLFMPVVWGALVPLAAFMVTRALGQSEQVSALSSLLILIFPMSVIWGAITVPMSLGYVASFWALYFTLRYLSNKEAKTPLFAFAFSLVSFLAHFLTGIISFVFLAFAMSFKRYEKDKSSSLASARIFLLVSFVFYLSLLPMSLPFIRLFTSMHPYFGLDKLNGFSLADTLALFIFGEYVNFSIVTSLVFGLGEIIGFLAMIYYIKKSAKNPGESIRLMGISFVLMLFLMLLIDYRILKLFLVNAPFNEERLWLSQNFLAVPFVAITLHHLFAFLGNRWPKAFSQVSLSSPSPFSSKRKKTVIAAYVLLLVLLSGWISVSVYYGYPHYGPLQTTSYEIEAAKYINENTSEDYIVIADQWFIYAGEIFYGVYNPHAFYFSHWDPNGVKLFLNMKMNPSPSVMIEAMKYNNASVAYFVVEEPRLGTDGFNSVIQQAQENGLPIYAKFGDGKLYVFYYRK